MTTDEARDAYLATMERLKLTFEYEFVPWSKSRSFKPNARTIEKTLNWNVTLKQDGRLILTTPYTGGIAYCPPYESYSGGLTISTAEALDYEVEHGKKYRGTQAQAGGIPILPDATVVLWHLIQDSDVLNYSTFEEWADNMGYDSDSLKAERVYKDCLSIGLKMLNALGQVELDNLREIGRDY